MVSSSVPFDSRALRSRRFAFAVVCVWTLGAAVGVANLPRFASVSVTDSAAFFPSDAPAAVARRSIDRLFPGVVPQSQIVLVLESSGPIDAHLDEIAALTARLRALPGDGHIGSVLSPSDDPVLAQRLIAADRRAALVVTRLSVGYASEESAPVVAAVERIGAAAATPDLRVSVSGDATLGRDYNVAIEEGALHAVLITLALVTVILLWVYRSPVVAAVSLLTLGAALATTFGLVVLAASLGLPVAFQIRAFLVAVVYGVGTDYCLLLFSRVREEYAAGSEEPTLRAWRASLPILLTSGAAVSVAAGLMGFARFGLFRFCGPALAIGVATTLAATLTLAPVLMHLLGPALFWPRRPDAGAGTRRLWPAIARLVSGRPASVLVVMAAALLPLALLGVRLEPTFDTEVDVPVHSPSDAGYAAVKRHFQLAMVAPLTLALELPENASPGFRGTGGLAALDQLSERLAERPGIVRVSSVTRPTGEAGLLARATLASQLRELGDGLEHARQGSHALASGLATARRELAGGQRQLAEKEQAVAEEKKHSLIAAFAPERLDDAQRDLAQLRGDLARLDEGLGRAAAGAASLTDGLGRASDRLRALREGPGADRVLGQLALTPADVAANPDLTRALDWYLTPSGDAARIELELGDAPSSRASVDVLRELDRRVPVMLDTLGLREAHAWIGGLTAITLDLEQLTRDDFRRVGLLVTLGTFLLLIGLLRGVASSAAITAWLLVSYLTALGAIALGVEAGLWVGLDWKTPFFLFVLLVAIGADYGVFLLGRVAEEERNAPFAPALARALVVTGPVVSSCGFVLAGSFGALVFARIAFLEQVGFGVTVGVLVDTLIVRPFLLPATALLLRRGASA